MSLVCWSLTWATHLAVSRWLGQLEPSQSTNRWGSPSSIAMVSIVLLQQRRLTPIHAKWIATTPREKIAWARGAMPCFACMTVCRFKKANARPGVVDRKANDGPENSRVEPVRQTRRSITARYSTLSTLAVHKTMVIVARFFLPI